MQDDLELARIHSLQQGFVEQQLGSEGVGQEVLATVHWNSEIFVIVRTSANFRSSS